MKSVFTVPASGTCEQRVVRLLAVALALLAASAVPLSAAEPVSAADLAALKQWLAAADSLDADAKPPIDDAFRRKLGAGADAVSDPVLRAKARALLPDLEKAAVLSARKRKILKDVAAFGGSGKTEPGGPAWLSEAVGADAMPVFARLTSLTAVDRGIPIKSGRLNEKVTDDWLQCLADLPDLRELDLQAAAVRGPGLKSIGTLQTLESLNLTLLPISDDALEPLAGLTNLRMLWLASTKVTGTGCKHLTGATKLVSLNLHSTPVTDAGMEQIGKLASLERLEIVHVHFTDEGAAHLAGLKSLKRLQWGSRDATGKALVVLKSLPDLRELDLHDGQASEEGLKNAGALTGLRVLRLSGGSLDGVSFQPLATLKNLETLVLIDTRATDAALDALTALPQLKRLEIHEPKVTEQGLAKLREALPKVEIVKP